LSKHYLFAFFHSYRGHGHIYLFNVFLSF
jgi:hypothetical protein